MIFVMTISTHINTNIYVCLSVCLFVHLSSLHLDIGKVHVESKAGHTLTNRFDQTAQIHLNPTDCTNRFVSVCMMA